MAGQSNIEWTDMTWNPTTGCTKISDGCKNCYAERIARRLKAAGYRSYRNGFKLTLQPHTLNYPLKWKNPRMVFVNSMSDLFHEDVPLDYILAVIDVIKRTPQHVYQVLTKRAGRLSEINRLVDWPKNLWLGVTIESCKYLWRADILRSCNSSVRFLSLEPLLSPMGNLELERIDWVIVGGESGPRARPVKPEWIKEIRDLCKQNNVPFFFKQWGGCTRDKGGRILEGRTWEEYPLQYYNAHPCPKMF